MYWKYTYSKLTKEGEQIKSENNATLAKLLKVKKPKHPEPITFKSMPCPVEVDTGFVIN